MIKILLIILFASFAYSQEFTRTTPTNSSLLKAPDYSSGNEWILHLPYNTQLEILGSENEFLKVAYKSSFGYVIGYINFIYVDETPLVKEIIENYNNK